MDHEVLTKNQVDAASDGDHIAPHKRVLKGLVS